MTDTTNPGTQPADIAERFTTGAWAFTPEVADVFPEHVRASVPYYDAVQDLIAETADWLLPTNGLIADLGAATGTTVQRIAQRHPQRHIRAILYDTEPAMLDSARRTLKDATLGSVDYDTTPIQNGPLKHTHADLTVSLFTLQFLPFPDRVTALRNARLAAADTGALIVAEKVRPIDSRWAEIACDASHDWKAAHGIDDTAIRAKARALRGVLTPYPQSTLTRAVTDAGWCKPETLFRWHNWLVIGAFATESGH